mmetsp:Transcript_34563/g.95604  ORF Transcript_34563/g.95604 Transcript_34563/m.95604 type:complete len:204 (+) Transcript_34563:205-816(+)
MAMKRMQSMGARFSAPLQAWKHCLQRSRQARTLPPTPAENSRQELSTAHSTYTAENATIRLMVQAMAPLTGGAYSVLAVEVSSQRVGGCTPRLRASMKMTRTQTPARPASRTTMAVRCTNVRIPASKRPWSSGMAAPCSPRSATSEPPVKMGTAKTRTVCVSTDHVQACIASSARGPGLLVAPTEICMARSWAPKKSTQSMGA